MVRVLAVLSLFTFAQDNKPPDPPANPHKNLPFARSLDKAMQYLKTKADKADPGIMAYVGWAFLLDGRDEFKPALDGIVARAMNSCKEEKHFNANWHAALSILFLAEVHKRRPNDKIAEALKDAAKVVAKTMEGTGGWCHHKGYAAESGYDRRGGGTDICMMTALMVAALMNAKAAGADIPQGPIANGIGNLKRLARGGLLPYGTGNASPDRAGARAAMLAYALWVGGQKHDPIFGEIAQAVPRLFNQTEQGHACGAQNFFALALGSYAIGQYGNFAGQWLGRLQQRPDGTVTMRNDGSKDLNFGGGHIADTAVYCVMILLQHAKFLENVDKPAAPGAAPGPKKNPFSQKE